MSGACLLYVAVTTTLLHGTLAKDILKLVSSISKDEGLPCVDFARSACLQGIDSDDLQKSLLREFDGPLNEEVKFAANLNKVFNDVRANRRILDNEEFADELSIRCDDRKFMKNYLRIALEEMGISRPRNLSCEEMVSRITEIVLSDKRESVDELVDVITKVRDLIAFDNLRTKNANIKESFRRTREFLKTVHNGYLEFIKSFDMVNSADASKWHEAAQKIEVELPMRTYKFLQKQHLDRLIKEYFACKKKILDIDGRERAFCLSSVWGQVIEDVPVPDRLADILHDLHSIRVRGEESLVYVRPAYAQLLLKTKDNAILLGTLGFEVAREITRGSYTPSQETLHCFEQQLKMNCNEGKANCKSRVMEHIYNAVALEAVQSILRKKEKKNESIRKLLYSSPLLTCNRKRFAKDRALNLIFSRTDDFETVFHCHQSSPMVAMQEEKCMLI